MKRKIRKFIERIYGKIWYLRTFKIPWWAMFLQLDATREYAPDYYQGKLDALKAISEYVRHEDNWGSFRHFTYNVMDLHYVDCQLSGGLDFNNWLGSWDED